MKKIFFPFLLVCFFYSYAAGSVELVFRNPQSCNAFVASNFWQFANSLLYSVANSTRGQRLSVCSADPATLRCMGAAVFPLYVGAIPVTLQLSTMEFEGAQINPSTLRLDTVANLILHANNKPLSCSRSTSSYLPMGPELWADNFESLYCDFGLGQQSALKVLLKLDLIDVDAGMLGGKMCISSPQQAPSCLSGGHYQYVVIRFPTPQCGYSADQYMNSMCAFAVGQRCHMNSRAPVVKPPPTFWERLHGYITGSY
jgi:hypothetical protein